MGRMQEAMRKAEAARAERSGARDPSAGTAPAAGAGSATSIAVAGSFRAGEADPRLVVLSRPESGAAQSYRELATRLVSATGSQPFKVVAVTSCVSGEGRSVTALNLACALAEKGGRRVVVVDADLRAPAVHQLLGVDNQRGLADYLTGGTMVEMVVQRSRLPNLWVLPAGRTPANPAELLGGKRMDDLLSRLRKDYDHVVLDTSAVVTAADASVVTPRADATLLVVRMERTPRETAIHAVELLAKAKANLVGTVIAGAGSPAAA